MRRSLNIRGASVVIIVLNSILLISVVLAVVYSLTHSPFYINISNNTGVFLVSILIIVLINSFVVIYDKYLLKGADKRYTYIKASISQIENLNNTLRAQRHDFLNQLQVMYSLLEMDEYQEAKNYIENVYKDILKVSRYLKTASPAVNALLQAKMLSCEKEDIKVELKVASQLGDIKIPAWELCRVLSNIIDNSIYELKEKQDNRYLIIEISQDIKNIRFKISNNGSQICQNSLERIFNPGYTTKGEKGEGMGLYIVKEIVDKYGGAIYVMTTNAETTFEIVLPRY